MKNLIIIFLLILLFTSEIWSRCQRDNGAGCIFDVVDMLIDLTYKVNNIEKQNEAIMKKLKIKL